MESTKLSRDITSCNREILICYIYICVCILYIFSQDQDLEELFQPFPSWGKNIGSLNSNSIDDHFGIWLRLIFITSYISEWKLVSFKSLLELLVFENLWKNDWFVKFYSKIDLIKNFALSKENLPFSKHHIIHIYELVSPIRRVEQPSNVKRPKLPFLKLMSKLDISLSIKIICGQGKRRRKRRNIFRHEHIN